MVGNRSQRQNQNQSPLRTECVLNSWQTKNTRRWRDHALRAAMSPLFQCLICGQTIERSMRAFWKRKGHLLCSSCRDRMDTTDPSHDTNTTSQ